MSRRVCKIAPICLSGNKSLRICVTNAKTLASFSASRSQESALVCAHEAALARYAFLQVTTMVVLVPPAPKRREKLIRPQTQRDSSGDLLCVMGSFFPSAPRRTPRCRPYALLRPTSASLPLGVHGIRARAARQTLAYARFWGALVWRTSRTFLRLQKTPRQRVKVSRVRLADLAVACAMLLGAQALTLVTGFLPCDSHAVAFTI